MIYLKASPIGIDAKIQRIQKKLYSVLVAKWGISESLYDCYGRCYRNQDEQAKYIPEFYTGKQGREYEDTLMNDNIIMGSFFGVSTEFESIGGNDYKTQVHLIYCVNDLKKLKPSVLHRADEEVHTDVLMAFRLAPVEDSVTSVITGMDRVFAEYTGLRAQDKMRFMDMHPNHCFRINFELTFTNFNC